MHQRKQEAEKKGKGEEEEEIEHWKDNQDLKEEMSLVEETLQLALDN